MTGRAYTVGGGGAGSTNGGVTTVNASGTVYGTSNVGNNQMLILEGPTPTRSPVSLRYMSYTYPDFFELAIDDSEGGQYNVNGDEVAGSVFSGGGGGGYVYYDGSVGGGGWGGVSIYGGTGGNSAPWHSSYSGQSNFNNPSAGSFPGGGGGSGNLSGAAGVLKIYHIN
jgi:hypothetical protein